MFDGALQQGKQIEQQFEGSVNGALEQGQSKFHFIIFQILINSFYRCY